MNRPRSITFFGSLEPDTSAVFRNPNGLKDAIVECGSTQEEAEDFLATCGREAAEDGDDPKYWESVKLYRFTITVEPIRRAHTSERAGRTRATNEKENRSR